jgi:hypothetical protein
MKTLEGNSLEDLRLLRMWAPYKFGGTLYLVKLPDRFRCYHTRASAEKQARKLNQSELIQVN